MLSLLLSGSVAAAAALTATNERPPATLARRPFVAAATALPLAYAATGAYAACLPSDAAV